MTSNTPTRSGRPGAEQDAAAGGVERRRLRTRAGEVVTVSVSLAPSGKRLRATLRFKFGGATVQRTIGFLASTARSEALRRAWTMLRDQKIAEKDGWSWVVGSAEGAGTAISPIRSTPTE